MSGITLLKARAVPLDISNVDTDRIIPARFLKQPRSPAYSDFLFHDMRFRPDGSRDESFPLNQNSYQGARILAADRGFGMGSAREGAVWALKAFGIDVVIASSFGDTFRGNCVRNGLLPIVLTEDEAACLRARIKRSPSEELTVDLPSQRIQLADDIFTFAIDPFEKRMLMQGIDELALTFGHRAEIEAFERRYHVDRPWLR